MNHTNFISNINTIQEKGYSIEIQTQASVLDLPLYQNTTSERTYFNLLADVQTTTSAYDLEMIEGHLIVADGLSGVKNLNISDPTNPVVVGQLDTTGEVRVISRQYGPLQNIVFAEANYTTSLFNAGFGTIGVTNPGMGQNITNPALLSRTDVGNFTKSKFTYLPSPSNYVAVDGDNFYVINGGSLALEHTFTFPGLSLQSLVSFTDGFGSYFLAFSTLTQGLTVFEPLDYVSNPPELTNPSDPETPYIETYNEPDLGSGGPLFFARNYLLKSDLSLGLVVYDVSDINNVQKINTMGSLNDVQDLITFQDYTITAHGDSGVKIWSGVDFSKDLTLVDEIDTPGSAVALLVEKNNLYVADSGSVLVYDLNPYVNDMQLSKEAQAYQNLDIDTLLPNGLHYVTDMELDEQGNLYIVGVYDALSYDFTTSLHYTGGTLTGNHEEASFLIKFDANGNSVMGQILNSPSGQDYRITDLEIDENGNLIFVTHNIPLTLTLGTNPLNVAEDYLFVFNYTSNFVQQSSVEIYTGGYDLQGTFLGDLGTLDTSVIHDELLTIAPDGNIYLAVNTNGNYDGSFPVINSRTSGIGSFATSLVKINSTFNIEWISWWGANLYSFAGGIASDNDYIYLAGVTNGTSGSPSVEGTKGKRQIILDQQQSPFVVEFTSDGSAAYYTSWDASAYVEVEDIELDYNHNIVIAGKDNQSTYTSPKVGSRSNFGGNSEFPDLTNLNGSGFVIKLKAEDFDTMQYHRVGSTTSVLGSSVLDIELNQDLIYFSATYGFGQEPFNSGEIWSNSGYFAESPIPAFFENIAVGIFNSTGMIYGTVVPDSGGNQLVSDKIPLGIHPLTNEFYMITDNVLKTGTSFGSELYTFDYNDTDSDGLADYMEINVYQSSPELFDTDNDGLTDFQEVYIYNTFPNTPDSDSDCLFDGVEILLGLNPLLNDASADDDGDGLAIWEEHEYGTSFTESDTDGDGLSDYDEVKVYFTDPLNNDPDGDGLGDQEEVLTYGTNPHKNDTDGDRLSDFFEVNTSYQLSVNGSQVMVNFDPLLADQDLDGLNDFQEMLFDTLPWVYDTDNDSISDYDEAILYFSAGNHYDVDTDGLNDTEELFLYFTNSSNSDSDNDYLSDYQEVIIYGTDPWNWDTDGDGFGDYGEVIELGLDPFNPDTDGDGLLDGLEVDVILSNANNNDTDGDGILDGIEYLYGLDLLNNDTQSDYDEDGLTVIFELTNTSTHPKNPDTDADGLTDGYEYDNGLDPLNADSDDDGLTDGYEINTSGTDPLYPDTDYDGLSDEFEINTYLTNPLNNDSDADGVLDGIEFGFGSNPSSNDSDSDNLSDYDEFIFYGTSMTSSDTDNDGLGDYEEIMTHQTDPNEPDSDFDGLNDIDELSEGTDPWNEDSDNEGLLDGEEVNIWGTEPLNNDTDNDGLDDYFEVIELNSDPNSEDTDGDEMPDSFEARFDLKITENDRSDDPDADNLSNIEEFEKGTYPNNPDTDGDGVRDDLDADPLDPENTDQIGDDRGAGERIVDGIQEEPVFAAGAIAAFIGSLIALFLSFRVKKFTGGDI